MAEVPQLLTTELVAERLGMSVDFVREHAGELGGIRAGRGARSPLRFHPESVTAWIDDHRLAPAPEPAKPRRRKPQAPSAVTLLPPPRRKLQTANG